MSELEEKLESVLGNPQAMAQIMSLAQSLNLGGPAPSPSGQEAQGQPAPQGQGQDQPAQGERPPDAPSSGTPAASTASSGGLGGILGALGGLDSGTLSAAAGLISQFNSGQDDQRTALLAALRPFVREERYAKLDKAVQIAKLSRLIRSGLELLRAHREDSHV